MAHTYNINNKPTMAYSPWVNGTVGRLNSDILASMRAMLDELKLGPQEWVYVINTIPTVLNEAPQSWLWRNTDGSTRSALEVMSSINYRRAVVEIIPGSQANTTPLTLERATAERVYNIEALQNAVHEMH